MSPRVVLVTKRTAYSQFVEEDQDPRARELLRRADPSVRRWKKAHENHVRTLQRVEEVLEDLGAKPWKVHGPQQAFDSRNADLVVTVGGDGTLLAASHHVGKVPILGVNSSPEHSIGFFCAATRTSIRRVLGQALEGHSQRQVLTRMQVQVAGRMVSRRVLNEALFCHAIPAATSRYILQFGRRREEQRSSGLWVATAAGSTGALRSAGGKVMPMSATELQLVVREPYTPQEEPYRLQQLTVPRGRKIGVKNKMQDAWLFLDGPFKKVRVELGQLVSFSTSDQVLNLIRRAE